MPNEFRVSVGRGARGRHTVSVANGTTQYVDEVNLRSAEDRDAWVTRLHTRRPEVDADTLRAIGEELLAHAARHATADAENGAEAVSLPIRAAELVPDAALFTDENHDTYCSVTATGPAGQHQENWPLRSGGFKRWMTQEFLLTHGGALTRDVMEQVLTLLDAKANAAGTVYPVAIRCAAHDGRLFIDMADAAWRHIEITPTGWRIINSSDCPVRFIRPPGMLPLPAPTPGGSMDALRALINLPDDDAWALAQAWLLAVINPNIVAPILVVNGEQGSAKSTLCRLLRHTIDPNKCSLRSMPHDEVDLIVAAQGSRILCYDNMSYVRPQMSDAICRIITGGGLAKRKLYTDGDEIIINARRPVMINGITDLATRADLLGRSIVLTLPPVPDERRRTEEEIYASFNNQHAAILGALCDTAVFALAAWPTMRLSTMPRMADFARWGAAGAIVGAGEFLRIYGANRSAGAAAALDACAVAGAVVRYVGELSVLEGTAAEIKENLQTYAYPGIHPPADWPKTARGIADAIQRAAPGLRAAGITATLAPRRGHGNRREWRIAASAPTPAPEPTPTPAPEAPDEMGAI